MSRGVSLNEAHRALSRAAITFGPLVKTALELWLQATKELPPPLQHPNTADATPLIQAALQAAPSRTSAQEMQNFSWLEEHLPEISSAMQPCVSGQLDMAAKRISILRALADKEQQSGSTQHLARFEAEHNYWLLMEVRTLTFFMVLPVATFYTAMTSTVDGYNTQYGDNLRVNSVKLGSDLISKVAHSLRQKSDIRAQLHKQKLAVQKSLPGKDGHTAYGLLNFTGRTCHLGFQACHVWVKLVTTLPSNHPDVLLLLDHVDWEWLGHTDWFCQQCHDSVKPLLSQLTTDYGLLDYLATGRQPHVVRLVLQYLLSTEDVRASSLTLEGQQQLLAFMQRPDTGKQPSSGSSTHSSQKGGDHSKKSSADDKKQQSGEEDLDDMQALLRMMYGNTVKV